MSTSQVVIYWQIQDGRILTDIVVETHQSSRELPFILHQHPDGRADTSVDELQGQDCAGHDCCFQVKEKGNDK